MISGFSFPRRQKSYSSTGMMRKHGIAACAGMTVLLVLSASSAYAGRIQDLSMSPNEMMQQNMNVNRPGVPLGGANISPSVSGTRGNGDTNWGRNNGVPPVDGNSGSASNNYMTGYCDSNFKPMVSRNAHYATMAACLEQQRQESCTMYRNLPDDARRAIDESINCTARSMNGIGENEDGTLNMDAAAVALPAACGAADSRRLEMIKKYWSDEHTAYAMVFVPDLVMDNSANCLKRR